MNHQASTETPQEHRSDSQCTNGSVQENMHIMPISVEHDHLNKDAAGPLIDDQFNTQEVGNGFLLIGNGGGPHIDELRGDNTARYVSDRIFSSHGTSGDPHPKGVNNGTPELDEDFDDRDLWDFFHPFCGYGAHPIRLGPYQYGGVRGDGLEDQDPIGHRSYRGYTRYPELHEDWVEPDHTAPLGFTEVDFALHFGPRPELDEDELGDNFISDLRLPRVARLPRYPHNVRISHPEAFAPAPEFTPLPLISPISLPPPFPLRAPEPRAPRTPVSRDSHPLREPRPVWGLRSVVRPRRFECCGTGQDGLERNKDRRDNLRSPFNDDFTISDFEDDLRALNANELRGPRALGSRRSSRRDLLQIRQSDGLGRPMRTMGNAGRRTPEWASGRIPEPLPAADRLWGMGRRR